MQRKFMRSLIVLMLVLLSQLAQAFVDPPTLSPINPTESQTVSVNIRIGVCDAFVEQTGYPQITQSGNAIRILIPSIHAFDSSFCNFGTGTAIDPIGAYPPGSYTIQVDRTYTAVGPTRTVVETLGILPFTVTAAPAPASLPTVGFVGLITLIAIILLIAKMVLRHRDFNRNSVDL